MLFPQNDAQARIIAYIYLNIKKTQIAFLRCSSLLGDINPNYSIGAMLYPR